MSLTNSPSWAYNPSTGFYSDVATQSLRFDDGSTSRLSRTPSSAGNRKTWTWSGWVKRGNLGITNVGLITAGTNNSNLFRVIINTDNINITNYVSNSQNINLKTNAVFRDTSAWYHIVIALDTTQATDTNRLKLYVNGSQITSFSSATYPALNLDVFLNAANIHYIGLGDVTPTYYFDGYMSEVNFIDGSQLTPTSFGETKNGIWIPKAYSGSYGTNGFRLEFNGNGNDSSGNGNNFTTFNISSHDYVPDCPENNWCTMSSLYNGLQNGYSEGTLKHGGNLNAKGTATLGFSSGKFYYEHVRLSGSGDGEFGVTRLEAGIPAVNFGDDVNAVSCWLQTGAVRYNGSFPANLGAFSDGDILNIAMDVDAGKVWFGKNNTWYNSGNPASGTNPTVSGLTAGTWTASIKQYRSGVFNFGQDSSFAGNKTSGSANAADDNDFGDFYYTPPSGYLALCSANMPDPDGVDPNANESPTEYFNTVLYTGSSGDQQITNVGFTPDWSWFKRRDGAGEHVVYDIVRGTPKRLFPNNTSNELSTGDGFSDFVSGGFSLVGNTGNVNVNGRTYVAWNWKAGGSPSSNTNGSITSSVSANQTAGFSIVTYTGNGSSGATIGHGLSQAPDLIITKFRQGGSPGSGWLWPVFHKGVGTGGYLRLNDNDGTTSNSETVKAVGSSTYTIGSDGHINQSAGNFVAYVFHEVEGYSKFGSYTGNASSDGTFIYTGFKPSFLIYKRTNGSNGWAMLDTKREPDNVLGDNNLFPHNTDAEAGNSNYYVDFLSNGFKLRTGDDQINSGNYIYIAFADQPFKYANAR